MSNINAASFNSDAYTKTSIDIHFPDGWDDTIRVYPYVLSLIINTLIFIINGTMYECGCYNIDVEVEFCTSFPIKSTQITILSDFIRIQFDTRTCQTETSCVS